MGLEAWQSRRVDIARSLADVPLFASVELSVRRALASHAQVIERKKRQSVIRQGAPADAIFAVVRGNLKVSIQSPSGSAAGLSVLGRGDVFGELGVLGAVTRLAALTALEDTTLLRIPGAVFLDALSTSPILGLSLSRLLAHRLRSTGEHFSDFAALPAPARFAQRLLSLLERFGQAQKIHVLLDLPLTQLDLAELAQLSRQRTNLLLQDLKRRGIIAWQDRRLVVLDIDALRTEALGV